MKPDELVVTGMGALAAGARTVDDLMSIALRGESPATWVELPGLDAPIAASLAPDPALEAELRHARRLDRAAGLCLAAARAAVTQAGLPSGLPPERVGVLFGSSRGPVGRMAAVAEQLGNVPIAPSSAAETGLLSLSGIVVQTFGFGGPTGIMSATCASAATAICVGALHLLAGDADAMVVGGAEAPLVASIVAQFVASRVTGSDEDPALTCKPFDVRRNGLMLGEGAAALVLERASSAQRRGAAPLARLTGWAYGADDGGRTGLSADGAGLVRATHAALARARLAPHEIGYVNAHGTATRLNDPVEARALNTVFGAGKVPPVSSTKPITGHCLGATPALEAIIAIEALRQGCLPPTANHTELDAECAIEVIAGKALPASPKAVLSTSMGFWGAQAALVFEGVD